MHAPSSQPAIQKILAEVEKTSMAEVARRLGLRPTALRLILHSAGDPRLSTVARTVRTGLCEPGDWFAAP